MISRIAMLVLSIEVRFDLFDDFLSFIKNFFIESQSSTENMNRRRRRNKNPSHSSEFMILFI